MESDYQASGGSGLRLERIYNSLTVDSRRLGHKWRHNYDRNLLLPPSASPTLIQVNRPDGKKLEFALVNGIWVGDGDVKDKLERILDTGGQPVGWRYTLIADDSVEIYNNSGRLLSITDRQGLTQTLSYDAAGKLMTVADAFGRTMTLGHNAASLIGSITDPSGGIYQYTYDGSRRLSTVTYPDGSIRTYVYENAAFPTHLTGIIDENNARYATWTYDANGRATSSFRPGNVELTNINYNTGNSIVTDTLGTARTLTLNTTLGVVQASGIQQPNASGTGNVTDNRTYDANGNVSSKTDFNGNRTCHAHDLTRNLETARAEGLGATACPADLN
jgi:YD repeat-containing protein